MSENLQTYTTPKNIPEWDAFLQNVVFPKINEIPKNYHLIIDDELLGLFNGKETVYFSEWLFMKYMNNESINPMDVKKEIVDGIKNAMNKYPQWFEN